MNVDKDVRSLKLDLKIQILAFVLALFALLAHVHALDDTICLHTAVESQISQSDFVSEDSTIQPFEVECKSCEDQQQHLSRECCLHVSICKGIPSIHSKRLVGKFDSKFREIAVRPSFPREAIDSIRRKFYFSIAFVPLNPLLSFASQLNVVLRI